jgi:pyrimidine deaminase RibD-like protein
MDIMLEKEIFEHLFETTKLSEDNGGIVSACLVRGNKILTNGFSTNDGIHAEYAVLQNIKNANIEIQPGDILYTTVIPCGKRTPGGQGEKYGDCTTNIIKSGIKHVIYAAFDHDASHDVLERFSKAGVLLEQTKVTEIQDKARIIFNDSVTEAKDLI